MKYYPIFLDIKDKSCLVVGGGSVGARKAQTLEKCGANVKVISKAFSKKFEEIQTKNILMEEKTYEKKDIKGMFLVFAATDNAALNQDIKKEAEKNHILCNLADAPEQSDFLLPSTVVRGDLILAISTSGSSPAMSKKIRQDLEKQYGPEYIGLLKLMGSIRRELLSNGHAPGEHKKIFYTLIEKGILEFIEAGDTEQINQILHDVLGKEYQYPDLVDSTDFIIKRSS